MRSPDPEQIRAALQARRNGRAGWLGRNPDFDVMFNASAWGSLVSFARTAAGLSQYDLGARLGSSQSAVARIEAGAPTIRTLARVAAETDSILDIGMIRRGDVQRLGFDGVAYAVRRRQLRAAEWGFANAQRTLERFPPL